MKFIIYNISLISIEYQSKSCIFHHEIAYFLSNFINGHPCHRKLATTKGYGVKICKIVSDSPEALDIALDA